MKSAIKTFIVTLLGIVIFFVLMLYASSWVGWYGYKKWEYRLKTRTIDESKKLGVFVKELAYDTNSVQVENFHVYIEKGHHWDKHSDTIYHLVQGSKYPYQLSFTNTNNQDTGYRIYLSKEELGKFDSADAVWGFLAKPKLPDTITVDIISNTHKDYPSVRVWEQFESR